MLRNIFSKIPSFSSVSSDMKPLSSGWRNGLRPISETRYSPPEEKVINLLPKRSASLPSLGKMPINDGAPPTENRFFVQKSCIHQSRTLERGNNSKSRIPRKDEDEENEYTGYKYEPSDQYELEAARPKKIKYVPYNVIEHLNEMGMQRDPLEYLQPSRLAPYGSNENLYSTGTYKMAPKPAVLLPSSMTTELEIQEKANKNQVKESDDKHQRRDYSTNPKYDKEYLTNLLKNVSIKNNKLYETTTTSKQKHYESIVSIAERFNRIVEFLRQKSKADEEEKYKSQISPPFGPSFADSMKTFHNSQSEESSIPNARKEPSPPVYYLKMPNSKFGSSMSLKSSTESIYDLAERPITPVDTARRTITLKTPVHKQNENKHKKENKYSRNERPFEPKGCETEFEENKCFLPSKLRLKPPVCTPRPPPCPRKPECIRADDCLEYKHKMLPKIKVTDCPCIPPPPMQDVPRLKRLNLRTEEPPRVCPCNPCPCQPRADDNLKVVPKILKPYIPKECACVKPPEMIDVPLRRLEKICVPEEVCYPKPPCPVPPPCVRADDCWIMPTKRLPPLKPKECPCVPPPPMHDGPRLKRLNLRVEEPPRVCPPKPQCECITRADGCLVVTPKKLRPLKPGDCPCISMPMKDVPPLKRLVCEDEEEDCYPEDPCYDTPRADMGCWEYYIPSKPKKKERKKNMVICPNKCK